MKLRDRDSMVTREGIIMRVYGYDHPHDGYFCDVEYAHESIYSSSDPRALRQGKEGRFYKFYEDRGLRFVAERYPHYMLEHRGLGKRLVGLRVKEAFAIRKADDRLQEVLKAEEKDPLIKTLEELLELLEGQGGFKTSDFGVFGSIQHGFHHPQYSDLDLVVYGRRELGRLQELLGELYREPSSPLKNEFEVQPPIGKWRFINYSPSEYIEHQRRKLIYAIYRAPRLNRLVKVEFEPVRRWEEVVNEYDDVYAIRPRGMVTAVVRVLRDDDAGFMPSIYPIEVEEVLEGEGVTDVERVVSYVEEFRLQAFKDEKVLVKGWLEEVEGKRNFKQITLTRKERYYEQVLKVIEDLTQ